MYDVDEDENGGWYVTDHNGERVMGDFESEGDAHQWAERLTLP